MNKSNSERKYSGKIKTVKDPEDVIKEVKDQEQPFGVWCPVCGDKHFYCTTGLVACKRIYPPVKFILNVEEDGSRGGK